VPTTATIEIIVDDAGAINAMQRVNAEAAKLGPTLAPVQRISQQAFDNIEGGALRARESAALLGEEFGVKIPRALRGVLATSAGIGPALTAAFSGLAIIGFIEIAERAGEAIASYVDKLEGWSEQAKKTMDAQIALNKTIGDSNDKVDKLQAAYRLIGLQGLPLFSEKQKVANEDLDAAKKKVSDLTAELAKLQKQATETQNVTKVTPVGRGALANITTTQPTEDAKKALASIADIGNQLAAAQVNVRELGQAGTNAGKELSEAFSKEKADGIREMGTEAQTALTKIQAMISGAGKAGAGPEAQIQLELTAKRQELADILTLQMGNERAVDQIRVASLALDKDASAKLIKLLTEEADKKFSLFDEEQNRELEAARQQAEKLRRMEDQTIMSERAAAIAAAPPWERANATIVANYKERMDKIREALATGDLDSQHAAREAAAAWTDAFSAMRDKLANDMQSLFDDITSGNIGQRFKKLFEQMVFQMVATWILGMQQMRSASSGAMGGGGGGILGAIFGSLGLGGIFGGGSSGGGQGGISGLPGVITNFAGGGGAPNASLGDLAGLGMASGMPSFSSGVGGGLSGSGETATQGGLGSALFGSLGLSAGGGAGSGTILPSGAGASTGAGGLLGQLKGLLSSPALQGTAGLALLASSFGKGGLLAGLMGAAGGGLATFAALSPLLAAGPIGWLVVGIGALVGFLGGFFQKSTKKARLAIEANVKAQSQKVEDAYNSFQMDFPTSNTQLEALRQQGVDALKQAGVKDISRSRVGHVDQWVDKAEKEIAVTQAERVRRAAIAFGPAEFRVGGLVGPGAGGPVPSWFAGSAMHFAGGGAVPAFLHEGEYVMRPEAVRRIGAGNLSRMNSGGGGGEVHNHYYINALDAKSVVELFRRMQFEGAW
jgi:hypothetical protein